MSRPARGVLAAAMCALAAVAVAVWIVGVRTSTPDALDPTTGNATSAGSSALVLDGVDDPVAPPTDHAERSVPVEIAQQTVTHANERAILAVRVIAIESGEQLGNVPITVRQSDDRPWSDRSRTCGAEGFEEVEVPAGEEVVVQAAGDGPRRSSAEARVPALAAAERRELVLEVRTEPDVVVHGIVLRSDTREGIADVVVEAVAARAIDEGPETTTSNDGSFRLALRSYATQELAYSHPHFGSARSGFHGHESATTPVVVVLEPGASIRASVVDLGGEPTKWWTVAAIELRAPLLGGRPPAIPAVGPRYGLSIGPVADAASATVSEGVADIVGLKSGRPLALEVRRGNRVVWRSGVPLVLAPGERRAVTIQVGGASVHGFVRRADGRAAIGLEVFAHPAGEDESDFAGSSSVRAVTESGKEGAYRFDGLEPGVWLVGVTFGNEPDEFGRRGDSSALVVERVLLSGGPVRHDIVVVRGLTIAGRVVDASGTGASGANVSARSESDPSTARTRAGVDGSFELQTPRAGPWSVHASGANGGATATVVAEAGTRDLVLRLEACGGLELELVDERDERVAADSVVLVRADGLLAGFVSEDAGNGRWSANCLRAGTVHALVSAPEGLHALQRDVFIVAGTTSRARIVLRPGGQARVRFDGPGDAASLSVVERGVVVRRELVVRGVPLAITGPSGEVELQLQVGGKRHDKNVVLAREAGTEIVFDGRWR